MQSVRFNDLDKLKDLLSKVELFEDFSRYDIPKIAELCQNVQFYGAEEIIIEKGKKDDSFFILLTGSARVCKSPSSESLFTIEPGFIFGEISFLSNTERTKYVVANDQAFALEISRTMLDTLEHEMRDRIKDFLINKLVKRVLQIESETDA